MKNRFEEFEKLKEIFEHQVFELCTGVGTEHQTDYLIPYMMNDAVEDYLILKNGRLVGEYLTGEDVEMTGQVAETADGYVLVVRQNDSNVFTVHFHDIEERINYYQYHRIGHFWVKGQEQWRRLVYIVGTIYEKYEYLGEKSCNDMEIELMKLVEFAPFCSWSPIHEPLEEKYPATYEGMEVMENLAVEAGDVSYARWIRIYRRIPTRCMESLLSRKLLSTKRHTLYKLICEKIKMASKMYQERDYGNELNEEIRQKRKEVHQKLTAKGFHGMYPEYQKNKTQIFVTEEHPFTMMEMEYENFVFRVQLMISENGKYTKIVSEGEVEQL